MEPLRPSDPRRIAQYEVLARLGAGGMGEVFLAASPGGRQVAVKLVHGALATDPDIRAGVRRELTAVRSVSGAYTAPFIDADPEAERPWLASAYLPGLTLAEAVAGYSPFPAASLRTLGVGLAEALSAIHRAGVVHRDLKPENVLLSLEGPRVLDFGVARLAEDTTGGAGSPGFMAPEQAADGDCGPAGDVFSLGAVLVFAATGASPFGNDETHMIIRRTLLSPPWLDGIGDPGLRAIIDSCLAKEPIDRPTADLVLQWLTGMGAATPSGLGWLPAPLAVGVADRARAPIPAPLRRFSRRTVLLAGGALAVAGAGAGGAVWAATRFIRDESRVLWTYQEARATAWAGPTVRAGLVLLVPGDRVVALDPATGRRRWQGADDVRQGAAPDTTWDRPQGDVLIEVGGGLGHLLTAPGSPQNPSQSQRRSLLTLDLATGQNRWRRTIATPIHGSSDPVRAGEVVCVREGENGGLLGLAADTGRQVWRVPGNGSWAASSSSPVPAFYADLDMSIRAVDASTGRQRWSTPFGKPNTVQLLQGLVVAGDRVLAVARNALYGLETQTGKLLWTLPIGFSGIGRPHAVRVSDLLLYTEPSGMLYALDAASGVSRWSFDLGARADAAPTPVPAVVGRTVVAFDRKKTLRAFDLATGQIGWQRTVDASPTARPVVASGRLHLCGTEALHTFDPSDGGLIRSLTQIRDGPGGAVTGGELLCALGNTLFFYHLRGEFVAVRA